jgi:hypothetical protein
MDGFVASGLLCLGLLIGILLAYFVFEVEKMDHKALYSAVGVIGGAAVIAVFHLINLAAANSRRLSPSRSIRDTEKCYAANEEAGGGTQAMDAEIATDSGDGFAKSVARGMAVLSHGRGIWLFMGHSVKRRDRPFDAVGIMRSCVKGIRQ